MKGDNTLKYIFRSGKNSKLLYFVRNIFRLYFVPKCWCRSRREALLRSVESRPDRDYIMQRVDYYCKLNGTVPLPVDADHVGNFHRKGNPSAYFFDTYEYLRFFPTEFSWCHAFGDIRDLQPVPSIVKSRPLSDDNANSVLLNLDKVRHFVFLKDHKTFAEKSNRVIFRGDIFQKPGRIAFMKRWFGDPDCDLGELGSRIERQEWVGSRLTLYQHLDYKFIMSLEGYDVASNLKWVMSSNSLAVMPRPTCETWYMEGRLIPNYHYVEVKPDFSDLKERMAYYAEHQDEAQQIINHAHEWVNQFRDKKREKLISLLVLDKYFRMTGQDR
jgi:hypothetical protein